METQVVNGAAKKGAGRKNGVYPKIVLERLNPVLLREEAARLKLAVGEEDSTEQVAVSLQAYYKDRQAKDGEKLFQCEVDSGGCGADQPRAEGACPFCGYDPDAVVPVVLQAAAETEPAPPPATDITDPASVLGPETTPVEPRARAKKGKALPPGREEKPGEMPPGGASTGLAKVVPSSMIVSDDTKPSSEVQTVRDLDEAIDYWRKANSATWLAWWHEGRALREIFTKKLWLLRLDPATKAPKYKSFQQFVSDEIKLTPNYVFDRMDAAHAYTEAQAEKLGMVNCVLLMRAPEEERKKIEERVHRGEIKSTRGVKAEVEKVVKEKGPAKDGRVKKGERKGAGRKKEFVKVAIAEQLGKSTIAFFETPEKGEKAEKVTNVPAAVERWLSKAQPFCQHESLDGEVVETFGLLAKDGRLSLVIHRRVPADDAAE